LLIDRLAFKENKKFLIFLPRQITNFEKDEITNRVAFEKIRNKHEKDNHPTSFCEEKFGIWG